jgi:pyruvate formate lyase activating enzyme
MRIGGLLKVTLADFPGTVASTVFTMGCPFRCHFCHNPELVLPSKFNPEIPEKEFFDFLHSRLGKIQGVCITGGEPLMQPDILEFIQQIKAIGFKVKLDTNGYYFDKLKEIIESGDVNYIAMDIKAPLKKYSNVTNIQDIRYSPRSSVRFGSIELRRESGADNNQINSKNKKPNERHSNITMQQSSNPIIKSIDLIMGSEVDYEFRTTVAKPLLNVNDILEISKMIKGAKKYAIQNYQKSKQINEKLKLEPFSDKELKTIAKFIAGDIGEVLFR